MDKIARPPRSVRADQRGIVSIVVVSVIIVVLALITLGFSKIMDRQLRQSLDQSLSTQAYYAAEAGLNDARAYVNSIKNDPNLAQISAAQASQSNKCIDTNSPQYQPYFTSNGQISAGYTGNRNDNVVKYTCVLLDLEPKELVYDVNSGQSVQLKVLPHQIQNLYFSWENRNYDENGPAPLGTCSGNSCQLPEENAIGPDATGILRVTIYPVNPGGYGNDPNQQLATDSRTYFLYPNAGSGRAPGSADFRSQNGVFVQGNCNNGTYPDLPFSQSIRRYCNAEITGLQPLNATTFYVHISSIYRNLSVSIQGSNGVNALPLPGAEAVADVTGEGNDVLHRLQARIPYNSSFAYPNYSVESMQTLCKRFRLPKIGPGPSDYGPAEVYDDPGDVNCNLDPGSVLGLGNGGNPGGGGPGGGNCTASTEAYINYDNAADQNTRFFWTYGKGYVWQTNPYEDGWEADIPLSTPISASCGKITINVGTYDLGHVREPNDTQTQERIFVSGYKSCSDIPRDQVSRSYVFTTPLTDDIPNTQTSVKEQFSNIPISQDVGCIRIAHVSLWPDGGQGLANSGPDKANSVHGVCVGINGPLPAGCP